jgi:hypothetical protein
MGTVECWDVEGRRPGGFPYIYPDGDGVDKIGEEIWGRGG